MTPSVSDDVMSRPSIAERLMPAQLDYVTSRVMVNRRALLEVLIKTWFVLTGGSISHYRDKVSINSIDINRAALLI